MHMMTTMSSFCAWMLVGACDKLYKQPHLGLSSHALVWLKMGRQREQNQGACMIVFTFQFEHDQVSWHQLVYLFFICMDSLELHLYSESDQIECPLAWNEFLSSDQLPSSLIAYTTIIVSLSLY